MHHKVKLSYSFLLLMLLFSAIAIWHVSADYGSLIQEAQQHWETYGVGGTCNHGTHNLFIADADSDNVSEIITGGFSYYVGEDSVTTWEAPLRIWSWNGQNLTLEKSYNWVGSIDCVYVADVDSDGVNEILTTGSFGNETGRYSSLRVWNWYNEELSLEAHYEGVPADSIFVNDLDNDNMPEIITVGRFGGYYEDSQYTSQLCLWNLEQNSLFLRENVKLDAADVTRATSVYAFDLDNDGSNEVITAGYSGNLNNSKGQLSVWNWNGEELSLKANENWQMVTEGYALNIAGGVLGNTVVNNLQVGDIDGDNNPEIVTGGFTYDGERANAQIGIWSWNDNTLAQESSQEWSTDYITEVKCISLGDVCGDSRMEIVTGGMVAAYGSFATNTTNPDRGQLGVWSWDGTTLTQEYIQEWTIAEGFCTWNVGTADLENDGTVEIVTVGCMSINKLCDPDMRIWSIENAAINPLFLPSVVAGIAAAALLSVAIFFVLKKRK
jgi:uncharacterized protein YuzB (UPF0349 family)